MDVGEGKWKRDEINEEERKKEPHMKATVASTLPCPNTYLTLIYIQYEPPPTEYSSPSALPNHVALASLQATSPSHSHSHSRMVDTAEMEFFSLWPMYGSFSFRPILSKKLHFRSRVHESGYNLRREFRNGRDRNEKRETGGFDIFDDGVSSRGISRVQNAPFRKESPEPWIYTT